MTDSGFQHFLFLILASMRFATPSTSPQLSVLPSPQFLPMLDSPTPTPLPPLLLLPSIVAAHWGLVRSTFRTCSGPSLSSVVSRLLSRVTLRVRPPSMANPGRTSSLAVSTWSSLLPKLEAKYQNYVNTKIYIISMLQLELASVLIGDFICNCFQ